MRKNAILLTGILICCVAYGGISRAQEVVNIGMFAPAAANTMEVRIQPGYAESGSRYLTNAQFTVRWPISSGVSGITAGTPVFPFFFIAQGVPLTNEGYYYQRFATSGGFALTWAAGAEIVVQTFTFTSPPCPLFEIADDAYVKSSSVNGAWYIEINGLDKTGGLYQAAAQQPSPGIPGAIAGPLEVVPPQSGVTYTTSGATNALTYAWSYSGTGVSINGAGTSVTLDFSEAATPGNLTVRGVNGCGEGAVSTPLAVSVPGQQAAVVSGTYRYYGQVSCNGSLVPYTPPLEGVTVVLQGAGESFTATTTATGEYAISGVPPGTYTVGSTYARETSGAVNALDAGQVNAWGVGPQYAIEKVRFRAGDALADQILLAGDAGRINYYFLSLGNPVWSSPLGMWSFWKAGETISVNSNTEGNLPTLTVGTTDVTQDFYGLVTGDFNQSMPETLIPADPCHLPGE